MAKNSEATLKRRNERRKYFRETLGFDKIPKLKVRICKICRKKAPCRFTSSYSITGIPEYRAYCITCQKVKEKEFRIKYRSKKAAFARKRKRDIKKRCVDFLGGRCITCGYNKSLRALTFHHRDPSKKDYTVSQIQDWGWGKIEKELEKCDLLCFNCHMELHDKLKIE